MKHLSLLGLLLFFAAVSCSDDSDVLNRLPEKIPIKLTAPSGLEIAQGSVKSNQLTLNWPPPSQQQTGSIAGYTVSFATKERPKEIFEQTCYSNKHTLTGLEKLTTYLIRIRANSSYDSAYSSEWSEQIEVTTLDVLEVSMPENLTLIAEGVASSQLQIKWDQAKNADSYLVAYKTESETEFHETTAETTFCTLTDLEQNTVYQIKVKSISLSGKEYDSDFCEPIIGQTFARSAGIFNQTDFLAFAATIAEGNTDGGDWKNAEGVVVIQNDLDFSDIAWTPIPTFSGTLDGNGKTISNLVCSSSVETMIGLFAQLSGTIRNLTLDASCAFTSTATSGIDHYTGSFVGKLLNSSTIDNCTNKATVTALVSGGGIAGAKLDKETVTISNCRNYGTVVFPAEYTPTTDIYLGGIIGKAETNTTISDCTNFGVVKSEASSGNKYNGLGGIAGQAATCSIIRSTNDAVAVVELSAASFSTAFIGGITGRSYASSYTSCTNNGAIRINEGTSGNRVLQVGGIAGTSFGNNSSPINYVDCRNTAAIEAVTSSVDRNTYLGGIIGYVKDNIGIVLSGCLNSGDLYATAVGSSGVGGIVGSMATKPDTKSIGRESQLASCTNSGAITCDVIGTKSPYQHCGGIAGVVSDASATIEECTNTGTITTRMETQAVAGGIVGETKGAVSGCTNRGDIIATRHNNNYCNLAGIAARVMASTKISSCRNYGNIVYMGAKHSKVDRNYIGFGGIVSEYHSGTIDRCEQYGMILDNPSATATNAGAIGAIVALSGASGKATISNCVIGGGFGNYDNHAADYGISKATLLTETDFTTRIFGLEVNPTTVTGCTYGNN